MSKLIGGKEALIALANGEEVELKIDNNHDWKTAENCVVGHFLKDSFLFRLKPRTITLNGIEVPAPFEPKEGDECFIIDTEQDECFYRFTYKNYESLERYVRLGAWRSEDEIKQVVSALRSIFNKQN